jgi:hypothetical protein
MTRQQEQGKYSGRLLVLVVFPDRAESSKVFKVNCDMLLNGEARFRPLFGWLGSRHSFDPLQVPPRAQAKAVPKAMVAPKAKAAPKAIATPKVIPKAKARQGGVYAQSILAKLVFRDGFAELKALLQATGKGEQNVWYWANKAQSDGWTSTDLYQKEQRDYQSSRRGVKRKKLGGSGPWFASRTLCLHLLAHWGHL